MSRLRLCPPRDTQQHNIFQFKEIATCILAPNRNCTASDRPLRRTIQGRREERQIYENPS